jgi:hypothetical protein
MNEQTSKMMYGVEDMDKWYESAMQWTLPSTPGMITGEKMLVMSMLSDVQEMIERGLNEEARACLNQAKWVIREKL